MKLPLGELARSRPLFENLMAFGLLGGSFKKLRKKIDPLSVKLEDKTMRLLKGDRKRRDQSVNNTAQGFDDMARREQRRQQAAELLVRQRGR